MRPRYDSFHGVQSNFGSFRHRRPADGTAQLQPLLHDDEPSGRMRRSPHQRSFYVAPPDGRRRCSVSATESMLLGSGSPLLTGGGSGNGGTPHIATPTIGTLPLWARRERFMKRNRMLSQGSTSTATPPQERSVDDPAEEPRRRPSDEAVDEAECGGRPSRFQLRLGPTADGGGVNNVVGTIASGVKTPSTTSTNRVQTPYSAMRNIHYEGGATPTQTIGPFSKAFPCSYYERSPSRLHFDVPSPNLLHPPTLLETGLLRGEAPPHQRDSVEKIPIRARSQSWLIRTRHLLDDEKLHRRTPIISKCMYILSVLLVIFTFPFCIPFCFRVAKEYERAVVFRLGRLIKRGTKGPGIFFIMPCIDTYKVVDLRVLSFDVPPQEILSRDSVTVSVEAVIYFRISNPVISVTNVNDAQFSTKLLAQTTLRNVLGTKTLSEILMERDNISSITEKVLDDGTDPWGVKVQRVEIKDIRLPHQLMRSMAAEAEAARDARARIIAADGERNASRSLVSAADTIRENKVSLHLRYLQTMSNIAQEHNHTIVLPLPMEIVGTLMRRFKLWQKVA